MSSQRDDYWTKVAAVFIASCALVGTLGSCVAAWQSWRTARATENIAREALVAGGARITLGPNLAVTGAVDCRQPNTVFAAQIDVSNSGRLAAEVVVSTETTIKETAHSYSEADPVSLAANSSRRVTVELSCDAVRYLDSSSPTLQVQAWTTVGGQDSPKQLLGVRRLNCRVDDNPNNSKDCATG